MPIVTSVGIGKINDKPVRLVGLLHIGHRKGFVPANLSREIKVSDFADSLAASDRMRKSSEYVKAHGKDIYFKK